MFSRRLKTGYFILEGLNSFAVVYYFYYFYFFMQQAFGFGNKANLVLAALNGGTYAVFAWLAGQFAQRAGYFRALKLGFVLMAGALGVGWWLGARSAAGQVVVMLVTVVGMTFTWPSLEALVSEAESSAGLQHMVGVYNVVWAATAAGAYFIGGAGLERLGPASLFYVPIAIQGSQLGLLFWLERQIRRQVAGGLEPAPPDAVPDPNRRAAGGLSEPVSSSPGASSARTFLRMAWLANPFAYIGIQTLIAVVPGVAHRLALSTMVAGFCCSVWCFARLGAFVGLWLWTGWHYRFRWLLLAYLALVGAFATVLLVSSLLVLVLAQVLFGAAVGLIYYSSLFYSMDRSETKGEHGGIHEAAIGLGNCAGPAVGAAALHFLPQFQNSSAVAVSLLLLCGLGGLTAIWRAGRAGRDAGEG
jgi:hypothetical protein